MQRYTRLTVAFAVTLAMTPTGGQLVNYELVPIGDPRNAANSLFGAVSYQYQIGKYEVTIAQYAAFLNAVAKTDTYSLYNPNMAFDLSGPPGNMNVAGIFRDGVSGSYTYSVTGPSGTAPPGADSPGDRPITFVSWWDSARFANWMSNGQPPGLQADETTENGAYALKGARSGTAPAMNATNPNTGSLPLFRIPTDDEWYKAAFYKGGSADAGYWQYATQSNAAPGNTIGSAANQANYTCANAHSVTQSEDYLTAQNYLSNVGAFTGSPSAYGTFDQSGNVREWNDLSGDAGFYRGYRGGSWGDRYASDLSSSGYAAYSETWGEKRFLGFRLSSPLAAMSLITVASGVQTQSQARFPSLSGSPPLVKVGAGTLVLDEANTITGSTSVQGGRLCLAHSTALASSRIVPLANGTLTLSSAIKTTVGGLDPIAGGLTDVGNGLLTVSAGLAAADVLTAIRSGRESGTWLGRSGITSTQAAADNTGSVSRAVGWLDNGDGSVTVAYAAPGDTNLDWVVDILDVSNLVAAGKYGTVSAANWSEGDFNYDGVVDIQDIADYASTGLYGEGAYNGPTGAALSPVPEPSNYVMALAGIACAGISAWRRRERA